MDGTYRHERRKSQDSGVRRGPSFLLEIPTHLIQPVLLTVYFLVAAADYLSPPHVWFGPAYLLVVAFAAWWVSFYVALAMGMVTISVRLMIDGASYYPYGPESSFVNLCLRFSAIFIVVWVMAMARRSLQREWQLARTDLLTGAMNRQAFFETVQSCHNLDGWSVLLFADLDGLKKINDEEGHEQGDRALVAFADQVRLAIRKDDVLARIGGDEFAVFMKVKDEQAGQCVAERLHRTINCDSDDGELAIRCSMGTLIIPPGERQIDSELRAADQLMYEAKISRSGFFAASAVRRKGALELSRRLDHFQAAERGTILRSSNSREKQPTELAIDWSDSLRRQDAVAAG